MLKRVKRLCKFKSKVKSGKKIDESFNEDNTRDESIAKSLEDEEGDKKKLCFNAQQDFGVITLNSERSSAVPSVNDTSKNNEPCSTFESKEDVVVKILEEKEKSETRICNVKFKALNELENLQSSKRDYLLHILDSFYPPLNFFDFCVIASEYDLELAEYLVELLQHVGLTGCVAGSGLGGDILEENNDLVNRCTKILFLITKDFTADRFCRRLQNAAVFQSLMAKVSYDRNKCVPVFSGDSGMFQVPLPLMGIAGLNILEPDIVIRRIKATYTPSLRQNKIFKAEKYLEQREILCRKLLLEHCEPLSENLPFSTSDLSSSSASTSASNFKEIEYNKEKSISVSPVGEIVENVRSLVAGFRMTGPVNYEEDSSQEITFYEKDEAQQLITIENSSEVHVGHQINLTVNVHNTPMTKAQSINSK